MIEKGVNIASQTVQIAAAEARAPATVPCLVISHGKDIGRRFILREPRMTLGRSPDSDVVLQDDGISRVHCSIEQTNGRFRIRDLTSRNGTFLDACRIEEANLPPGSIVQIGQTRLHLAFKDPATIAFENDLAQNATTDPLTGIANRRMFMTRASEELGFARRTAHTVVTVMADVDGMNAINEKHGHPGGDYVLSGIARLFASRKRREDILGRHGDDEFVLMPRGNLTLKSCSVLCERIRKAVAAHSFEYNGQSIAVTLSFGICFMAAGEEQTMDELIATADKALCRAKTNGRNRVEFETIGRIEH